MERIELGSGNEIEMESGRLSISQLESYGDMLLVMGCAIGGLDIGETNLRLDDVSTGIIEEIVEKSLENVSNSMLQMALFAKVAVQCATNMVGYADLALTDMEIDGLIGEES